MTLWRSFSTSVADIGTPKRRARRLRDTRGQNRTHDSAVGARAALSDGELSGQYNAAGGKEHQPLHESVVPDVEEAGRQSQPGNQRQIGGQL